LNRGLNIKYQEVIYFGIYFYTRKSMEHAYGIVHSDQRRHTVRVGGGSMTLKEATCFGTLEVVILGWKHKGGCRSIYNP
jgi:hypothetical protein